MTTILDETALELRSIATSADDASGYFPALYARVTARIGRSILDGRFERPEQMELFAARFVAYYIEAWRGRFTVPGCWRAAADVAGKRELLIVQHLFLGINAHVNHDLPLAVVAAADVRGNLAAARADFDAVNDVLADTFGDVLDDLDRVSRWTNEAAALGGGRLFNFSLRVARRQAWGAAERLHRLDAAERERYTIELDRMVTVLAYLVTRPSPAVRPLVWLARRLEEDDPRTVTIALLGDVQ